MVRTAPLRLALAALILGLAGTAHAAVETWKLDTSHSSVGFTVRHNVISKVSGSFATFDGTITFDPAKLETAVIDVTIDASSVDTNNDGRDKHLKTADFFDVTNHPNITFKSTAVKPKDKESGVLSGDLTINGVTKPVELNYTVLGFTEARGSQRGGFEATGTINRKDFNVNWSKTLDNGGLVVSDNVDITLEIQAAQPKPEEAKPAGKS